MAIYPGISVVKDEHILSVHSAEKNLIKNAIFFLNLLYILVYSKCKSEKHFWYFSANKLLIVIFSFFFLLFVATFINLIILNFEFILF